MITNWEYQNQELNNQFEDFFNPNTILPEIFKDECIIDDLSSAWKLDVTEQIKRNFMKQSRIEESFNKFFLSQPESSLLLESNESTPETPNLDEYFNKDQPNNISVVSQFNLQLPEAPSSSNCDGKFFLTDKDKDDQSQRY